MRKFGCGQKDSWTLKRKHKWNLEGQGHEWGRWKRKIIKNTVFHKI